MDEVGKGETDRERSIRLIRDPRRIWSACEGLAPANVPERLSGAKCDANFADRGRSEGSGVSMRSDCRNPKGTFEDVLDFCRSSAHEGRTMGAGLEAADEVEASSLSGMTFGRTVLDVDSVVLPLLVLALDLDLPPKANASRRSCVGESTASGLNSFSLRVARLSRIVSRPVCS